MPEKIDIGEDTGDMAGKSKEELAAALKGADTEALDRAVDAEYGRYLDEWADQIRRAMKGEPKD